MRVGELCCLKIENKEWPKESGILKESDLPWSVLVAGFQLSAFVIGRHTWPFSSTLGWYIFVKKVIFGGLNGYSVGNSMLILKAPLLYGTSSLKELTFSGLSMHRALVDVCVWTGSKWVLHYVILSLFRYKKGGGFSVIHHSIPTQVTTYNKYNSIPRLSRICEMTLRQCAIRRWVPSRDLDGI